MHTGIFRFLLNDVPYLVSLFGLKLNCSPIFKHSQPGQWLSQDLQDSSRYWLKKCRAGVGTVSQTDLV